MSLSFDADDFELFGLPRQFAQDVQTIDARWKALQREVHPDRFSTEGAAAQRLAMQWAVRVNEARQRLRDPLRRAAYLCELQGAPVEPDSNTAMPAAFLIQQMAWREALDEATDLPAVEALLATLQDERAVLLGQIETALDTAHDPQAAAGHVRALMFVERFALDVDGRLEALGQ